MRDPRCCNLGPWMFPADRPCYQAAASSGRLAAVHSHRAYPDANGNGLTEITANHFHKIQGGLILPDESDGHTHRLSHIPCGAGR